MKVGHFDQYPRYNLIESDLPTFEYINKIENASTVVLCKSQDLTETNKELLSKILQAVGETIASVDIISINKNGVNHLNSILKSDHLKVLLSFEVNLNNNGLNLHQRLYHIINMSGLSILISESLTKLTNDKGAKMKLWTELQKLYTSNKSA